MDPFSMKGLLIAVIRAPRPFQAAWFASHVLVRLAHIMPEVYWQLLLAKIRRSAADISELVRMLLGERYADLPDENEIADAEATADDQ